MRQNSDINHRFKRFHKFSPHSESAKKNKDKILKALRGDTIDYFQKNSSSTTWMNLKNMLNKRSQSQRTMYFKI